MKKVTDFISNRTLTADDGGKKVKFNRHSSYSDDFSLEGRGFHLLDPLLSKGEKKQPSGRKRERPTEGKTENWRNSRKSG